MGGGVSLSVDEIDMAPSSESSPMEAIQYCRKILQRLTIPKEVEIYQDGGGQPLSSHVSFDSLLEKLKHVEASLLWLSASERRSSERENQDVQRKLQNERLRARLAKRNKNNNKKTGVEEKETIEEIALETPRTAARTAAIEKEESLTPRYEQVSSTIATTPKQQLIHRTLNEIRRVIVDSVIWITRLLQFGNQSTLTGHVKDGLNAFEECERLLEYVKGQSSVHNTDKCLSAIEQSSDISPWDHYSRFSVQCPLFLLLKSREIKKGVSSYFDFQTLMYGINAMHAEAFGQIEAMMFGNLDHPDDHIIRPMTPPPIPVHQKHQLNQFLDRVVRNQVSGMNPTGNDGRFEGKKMKLLDVGCGCGSFFTHATKEVQNHIDYVGIDISQESINMATKQYVTNEDNIIRTFICQDIVECDFGENEFDIIILNDVINFIPPSETLLVLSKLKNWLCHEGEMFVTAPLISFGEEAAMEEKNNGEKPNFMCGIERSHPFIPGLFFRMFRQDELPDMCTAVDLQVRRVEILEPTKDETIDAPKPGPPVMMSRSPTAWGSGNRDGSGSIGSSGGENNDKESNKTNTGNVMDALPSLGSEDSTPYRVMILIVETK